MRTLWSCCARTYVSSYVGLLWRSSRWWGNVPSRRFAYRTGTWRRPARNSICASGTGYWSGKLCRSSWPFWSERPGAGFCISGNGWSRNCGRKRCRTKTLRRYFSCFSFPICLRLKFLQEVNDAVMKEYLQRVYNSILSHPDLQSLGEGIPQLLVQQAQSVVLMHRFVFLKMHFIRLYLHRVMYCLSKWLKNLIPFSYKDLIYVN